MGENVKALRARRDRREGMRESESKEMTQIFWSLLANQEE
jgi:hypothetical protein